MDPEKLLFDSVCEDYIFLESLDEDLDNALHVCFVSEIGDTEQTSDVGFETFGNPLTDFKPQTVADQLCNGLNYHTATQNIFIEYNEKYFNGLLQGVKVIWCEDMTQSAGLCSYGDKDNICAINLSIPLLKNRPHCDLLGTLLHQMIHVYLFVAFQNKDYERHGPKFLEHMCRINREAGASITIYHSFLDEADLHRQHWWKCGGCCQNRRPFYGLLKRVTNIIPGRKDKWWVSHKAICSGRFKKVKLPRSRKKNTCKRKHESADMENAYTSQPGVSGVTLGSITPSLPSKIAKVTYPGDLDSGNATIPNTATILPEVIRDFTAKVITGMPYPGYTNANSTISSTSVKNSESISHCSSKSITGIPCPDYFNTAYTNTNATKPSTLAKPSIGVPHSEFKNTTEMLYPDYFNTDYTNTNATKPSTLAKPPENVQHSESKNTSEMLYPDYFNTAYANATKPSTSAKSSEDVPHSESKNTTEMLYPDYFNTFYTNANMPSTSGSLKEIPYSVSKNITLSYSSDLNSAFTNANATIPSTSAKTTEDVPHPASKNINELPYPNYFTGYTNATMPGTSGVLKKVPHSVSKNTTLHYSGDLNSVNVTNTNGSLPTSSGSTTKLVSQPLFLNTSIKSYLNHAVNVTNVIVPNNPGRAVKSVPESPSSSTPKMSYSAKCASHSEDVAKLAAIKKFLYKRIEPGQPKLQPVEMTPLQPSLQPVVPAQNTNRASHLEDVAKLAAIKKFLYESYEPGQPKLQPVHMTPIQPAIQPVVPAQNTKQSYEPGQPKLQPVQMTPIHPSIQHSVAAENTKHASHSEVAAKLAAIKKFLYESYEPGQPKLQPVQMTPIQTAIHPVVLAENIYYVNSSASMQSCSSSSVNYSTSLHSPRMSYASDLDDDIEYLCEIDAASKLNYTKAEKTHNQFSEKRQKELEWCGAETNKNLKQEKENEYQILLAYNDADFVANTEEFECSICFAEVKSGEGITLQECLHNFCRDCLAGLINHSETPEVQCPFRNDDYACESHLRDREIKSLVTPEVYERHLQRSLALAENQAQKSFHCKTPDCPSWCFFEDDVNIFHCHACNHFNCITCGAIHEGLNCFEYQTDLEFRSDTSDEARKTRDYLKNKLDTGEAMRCPQCQVILMKKDGCDNLKCTMCHLEICWVTKGPRWGPKGFGDTSGGCRCQISKRCHPKCKNCH